MPNEQDAGASKVDLSQAPWAMHEFFAGSGLVAFGLKGILAPVWSNDISEKKAGVYAANFNSGHFVLDDIANVNGKSLPFAHVSWASFPCQDLSLAGSLGGIDASRSGLVWQWLRVISEMKERPAILAMENVAGLLSSNGGQNYAKLHVALLELGYRSGAILLDAALFLPQSRPRVFVMAVRRDLNVPEALTDSGPNWLHNRAAANLGRLLPEWIWWQAERPPERSTSLSDIVDFSVPYDRDEVLRLRGFCLYATGKRSKGWRTRLQQATGAPGTQSNAWSCASMGWRVA